DALRGGVQSLLAGREDRARHAGRHRAQGARGAIHTAGHHSRWRRLRRAAGVIAQQTGLAPLERSLPAKAKARAGLGRTLATLLPWLVCIGIGIAAYAGSLGAGIMF